MKTKSPPPLPTSLEENDLLRLLLVNEKVRWHMVVVEANKKQLDASTKDLQTVNANREALLESLRKKYRFSIDENVLESGVIERKPKEPPGNP